jgi:transposase
LDYHQEQVQLCVLDESGKALCNRTVANDAAFIHSIAERYGGVQGASLEACCGAANLAQELVDLGWSVSLAHPGFVARMKQNPDKTDYADARLLADLLRVGYLPKVWLAPERLRRFRRLVRYRQQLVDQRRDVKLRIRALLRENRLRASGPSPWTVAWLAWV